MTHPSMSGKPGAECTADGCPKPAEAGGMCSLHHQRWKKYGTTAWQPGAKCPVDERWVMYADWSDPEGCWPWTGEITRAGYGRVRVPGGNASAHRVGYELFRGPIPEGLQLDHLCRNRKCVNPAHLEAVTPQENVLRSESPAAKNAQKTHCLRGHELSPDNLYPNLKYRVCIACSRARTTARDKTRAKRSRRVDRD